MVPKVVLPRLGAGRVRADGPARRRVRRGGPPGGEPVVLLHGFPYDVHSYVDVVPRLADRRPARARAVPARARADALPRSGDAALGAAGGARRGPPWRSSTPCGIDRAVLAGYDWGGRAACVVAALWPERCAGLVSVNGYLVQDLSVAARPLRPDLEAGFWYFFYFLTERGRAGLTANRREIARVIWTRNSPGMVVRRGHSSTARPRRSPNPDYVDVVVHSYRHRLGLRPTATPGTPTSRGGWPGCRP